MDELVLGHERLNQCGIKQEIVSIIGYIRRQVILHSDSTIGRQASSLLQPPPLPSSSSKTKLESVARVVSREEPLWVFGALVAFCFAVHISLRSIHFLTNTFLDHPPQVGKEREKEKEK